MMTPVRIYCFRAFGYYGFGLTAKQAVNSAVTAGLKHEEVKHGFMIRLPEKVTAYDIDGFGGSVYWQGEPDTLAEVIPYETWSKEI